MQGHGDCGQQGGDGDYAHCKLAGIEKVKKDEAQDAKNKKNGVGSIFFVGNLRSDSRFVFPQSITVIHEQEVAAGCAETKPSSSKERKASAKISRCGNSFWKAWADDDEAASRTACSKCEVEL